MVKLEGVKLSSTLFIHILSDRSEFLLKMKMLQYSLFCAFGLLALLVLILTYNHSLPKNIPSNRVDLVYDVYLSGKKVGTVENIDELKRYVGSKVTDLYGPTTDLYFSEQMAVDSRYLVPGEVIPPQEPLYKEIWAKGAFSIDALKMKVVQQSTDVKTYIVKDSKVWQDAITTVETAVSPKLGQASSNFSIDLDGQVEREKVRVPLSEVLTKQEVVNNIMAPSGSTHRVLAGESISNISAAHKMTEDELKILNPQAQDNVILLPGAEVRLADPVYELDFSKIEIEDVEEVLLYDIEYIDDETQYVGKNITLTAGKDGRQKAQYVFKYNSTGEKVYLSKQTLAVIEPATTAIIRRGTKEAQHIGTGQYIWPSAGRRVAAEFMDPTYGFGPHYGIDINDRLNGEIYAADNGTVITATYSSGYGNHVIINHNNGMWTLYAHMNTLNVRAGEVVEKGRVIGGMGTTGFSTGVHLHFEMRVGSNDKMAAVNARTYITP
ncbi:MAG: peptidoglycan DD-metalloendopeptidase family protein [Culicoidibacterales bacterium]